MFHVKHPRARWPPLAVRRIPSHPEPSSSCSPARSPNRPAGAPGRPPAPRDDHGGGRLQVIRATSHHLYIDGAKRRHHTPVIVDLVLGSLALDGQHPSIRTKKRHAPLGQFVQGRHRPGDNRVHLPHPLSHRQFLGPPTDNRDVQRRVRRQPRAGTRCAAGAARSASPEDRAGPTPTVSPVGRLHYRCPRCVRRSPGVRPRRRCSIGAAPTVDPPPAGPTRPRSTPAPASISAYCRARSSPTSEEDGRGLRRRGHLHMFHVKHPPDLAGRQAGGVERRRTTSL